MFADLVARTRSYRRFNESREIDEATLHELVGVARLAPSGGNKQSLRFITVADRQKRDAVFATLMWAAHLKDWPGPAQGERPTGYVIITTDANISKTAGQDPGLAAYAILLAATERGLGGCMLGSINKPELMKALKIPDQYPIQLVVALGEPAETVIIDDAADGKTPYYRDDQDRHHVPKLPLDQLILKL